MLHTRVTTEFNNASRRAATLRTRAREKLVRLRDSLLPFRTETASVLEP